jgi:signal peptidase I
MNDRTYPKWVGVILGCLLSGSAHFLCGQRAIGIRWYIAIAITSIAAVFILAVPGVLSLIFSVLLFLSALLFTLIMLKQSYRPVRKIGLWGWLAVLAVSLMLNTAWEMAIKQVVQPFSMPTETMAPTLQPGDHILVEKASYWFSIPKRGDIVVFYTGGIDHPAVSQDTYYVKRILGLPGESIQIDPPHILINGYPAPEIYGMGSHFDNNRGYILPPAPHHIPVFLQTPDDTITLGDGEYLVLGDNSLHSLDSRYFGPVTEKHIIGRVSRIYWPLSRICK